MADLDTRLLWIKKLVYTGLGLKDDELFKELIEKEEKKNAKLLYDLLNSATKENGLYSSALIFYSLVSEITREIEVEEGITRN